MITVIFLCLLILTLPVSCKIHSDDATSKTFFSVAPHYSTGRPEHLSLYRNRMLARQEGYEACVQATFFGGKTNSSASLARYFLPSWKTCILVAESPDPLNTDGNGVFLGGSTPFKSDTHDVLAQNFNIATEEHSFYSNLFFEPRQSYFGVALNYMQSFLNRGDYGFWFDITVPIIRVTNSMNLNEVVKNGGTTKEGHPRNLEEAFVQEDWKYGRIQKDSMSETGVADIEVRLGYDSIRKDICTYGSFLGLILPTGNKPKAHWVFEPIVGRNKHWGILWGTSMSFAVYASKDEETTIRMAIDSNNSYLFEGDERRSFDLKDKEWSRYINVFTDIRATTTSPGINTFTQDMKIRPRGTYQLNTAFVIKHKGFDVEVGLHNLFSQSEEGSLDCPWQDGPAIAGVNPALGGTSAESMSLATMKMWNYKIISPDVDYGALNTDPSMNVLVFKTLQEEDLNLQSALQPSTIASTIYGCIGYTAHNEYLSRLAVGASYQYSADNTSLNKWSVWGKASLAL